MSPDDQAFVDAILADPDDDLPRLVYADWLDERGDPYGEFIRLQIDRAHHKDDASVPGWIARNRRERQLLVQNDFFLPNGWAEAGLLGYHNLKQGRRVTPTFERGWLVALRMSVSTFHDYNKFFSQAQ